MAGKKYEIKIGSKYGMLTVLRETEAERQWNNGKLTLLRKVECLCDCGNKTITRYSGIKRGQPSSCGCLRLKIFLEKNRINNFKHGLRDHRLFNIWCSMRQRCNDKNNHAYKNYGGRGITVCDEWQSSFLNFYNWAVNNGHRKDLSIDRINNNGNYEPLNCRWATKGQQSSNRRNNRLVVYDYITYTLTDACKITGVPFKKFYYKIKYQKLNFEEQVYLWKIQKQRNQFASISDVVRASAKASSVVMQ